MVMPSPVAWVASLTATWARRFQFSSDRLRPYSPTARLPMAAVTKKMCGTKVTTKRI
jgi:hypothetical protein